MKTLLIFITLVGAFSANARSIRHEEFKFQTCTSGDMNLLQAATVRGNQAIIELVKKDTIENGADCMVKKPRYFHPMVCGTTISQIDTFIINTKTDATYTVVVDSSYRSCLRMRVIPMIKSLKFEPTPRVIPFH
ncbi:MAG: hypothetical protein ACJAT2_002754 [Bacteriovoracaceae bacterium]|jgi:hypothetical protein